MGNVVKFRNNIKSKINQKNIDLIHLFESYTKSKYDLTNDEIANAIVEINDYVIGIVGKDSSKFSDHLCERCATFVTYLYNITAGLVTMHGLLDDRCGDELPTIINTGLYFKAGKEDAEFLNATRKSDKMLKDVAAEVVMYILAKTHDCCLTLSFMDGSLPEYYPITAKRSPEKFNLLYFHIMRISYKGGSIIVKEIINEDKCEVSGFSVDSKEGFSIIPANELMTCVTKVEDNEVYVRPNIILSD